MTQEGFDGQELLDKIFKERPEFDRSERKFRDILPGLLNTNRGMWIAIAGDTVYPPRKNQSEASQDAKRAGIQFGDYTVRLIEEDPFESER